MKTHPFEPEAQHLPPTFGREPAALVVGVDDEANLSQHLVATKPLKREVSYRSAARDLHGCERKELALLADRGRGDLLGQSDPRLGFALGLPIEVAGHVRTRPVGEEAVEVSFLEAPKEEREPGPAGASIDAAEESEAEDDPLYQDAVRLVVEFGKASTSLLQRRLRIGYGRAAHLIDLMEQEGIVGAADGPKPREVLKRPDWVSEIEESMR